MIRAILACDENWGIGKSGALPWPHNPADLKWFKTSTLNHTIVMGKATWDSLPVKPLPNRVNVVVSSSDILAKVDVLSISDLRRRLSSMDTDQDVWIIGGADLIRQSLDIMDEIWLNEVEGSYDCDTFLDKELITENFVALSTEEKSFGTITKWIRD